MKKSNSELHYNICPHCKNTVYHQSCGNCKHFHQHYGIDHNGEVHEIFCGHCVTPRQKIRKPSGLACEYWEPKETE